MRSLLSYYEEHRPRNYKTGWHHRMTCDVVERCYRERKHGIIEVPPRHGKSEIINIYAPAWWLEEGHHDSHFGLVCNGQDLANKFARASRNLCKLPVAPDHTSEWKLTADKSTDWTYRGTGINGSLAGFGYSEMSFDDLFKNGMEAKSEVKRSSIIDGVVSQAMNRLTPDGILIATQARLHPSDTIGWLLSSEDRQFLRLHLPAVNESGRDAWFEDQYSGQKIVYDAYSALWPERYGVEQLKAIYNRITSYYWMAQFQQVPSLGDLSYFDVSVMPRYKMLGTIRKLWIAVDAANTETETGAYTAFVCLAKCSDGGDHIKVLNVKRGRWRPDVISANLIDYYNAMQRRYGVYPEVVCVERAAAGYGLLNLQLPIVPMTPKGDKEERAGAVCWLVNRGLVQLPEEAQWLKDFTDELENFPLTTYKDQVDAFVHALAWELRKGVDFEPKLMERYAQLMPSPTINGVSLDEIEDAMVEEIYQDEWGHLTR
jgi:predicted phage terminase large subunit-like protein